MSYGFQIYQQARNGWFAIGCARISREGAIAAMNRLRAVDPKTNYTVRRVSIRDSDLRFA